MKEIAKQNILQTIGKNIKSIRLLRGFSQEQLADKLQKSINFVSLVERGESGLAIQTIVDICKVLNVDVNSIFEGVIEQSSKLNDEEFILNSLSLFDKTDKSIIIDLINYIVDSKKNYPFNR